jgi:hypothetical protein
MARLPSDKYQPLSHALIQSFSRTRQVYEHLCLEVKILELATATTKGRQESRVVGFHEADIYAVLCRFSQSSVAKGGCLCVKTSSGSSQGRLAFLDISILSTVSWAR